MKMLIDMAPSLWQGTMTTLLVFAVTLVISYPLSLVLSYLYSKSSATIKKLFQIYINIERGTPLLLQLMFVYFGLPFLHLPIDRMSSVFIAFILNYTAYFMEINRSGIEAIDLGQLEAAQMLGYTKAQTFLCIVLPQAFKITLPSLSNECLTLVKDTSLITVLGISELLKVGRNAVNTYATALPFVYVGIIYLVLTSICAFALKQVEIKMNYYR